MLLHFDEKPDFVGERGGTRTLNPMIKVTPRRYRTLAEHPATILLPNSGAERGMA